MSDEDTRGIALRVTRLLKGVEFLAQPKFGFLDRHPITNEYKEKEAVPLVTSVVRGPSRRNVALQSIFGTLETPPAPTNPVPTVSNPSFSMASLSLSSTFSSSLNTTPYVTTSDYSGGSSLFTSIWTPSSRPESGLGDGTETNGWN